MDTKRCLEIGPGLDAVKGFETFNLSSEDKSDGNDSTHVGNAKDLSRFKSETFDVVYSSHCIEHFHWYHIQGVINEWARVVKSGGSLEIWTVNGREVIEEIIKYENTGKTKHNLDLNWKKPKTNGDPYLWLVGKLYNYTKDPSDDFDYHLHRTLITPTFLKRCFVKAGLKDVRDMDISENRLINRHGWMNMGVIGWK